MSIFDNLPGKATQGRAQNQELRPMKMGNYTLAAVPIVAEDYMKGFEVTSSLPGPERVAIIEQNQRMFEAFERFGAWIYPVGRWGPRGAGLLWKVMFPAGSKWKDGQPSQGALAAIHNAYAVNKRFAGYNVLAAGDAALVLDTDKILDKAVRYKRADDAHLEAENLKFMKEMKKHEIDLPE